MEYAKKIFLLPNGLFTYRLCIEIAYMEEIVYKIQVSEDLEGIYSCGSQADTAKICSKTPQKVFLQLAEYFLGKRTGFDFLAAFEGTQFQQKVWREIMQIPYGETASYADLAERINMPRAYRAVARACHDNPLPIVVPCHRVIAKNGGLGGYAYGPALKTALLNLEKNGRKYNDYG